MSFTAIAVILGFALWIARALTTVSKTATIIVAIIGIVLVLVDYRGLAIHRAPPA